MQKTPSSPVQLNLTLKEVVDTFNVSFGTNLKIMKSLFGLRSLEVFPDLGSPLRLTSISGEIPLTLPVDEIIGLRTFLLKQWDINKVNFFATKAAQYSQGICLVDVGANVGLFSRQLASKSKNITQAFLYEPHPDNFEFLKRNLAAWAISPNLINAALSDIEGILDFYEDPTNCGNYSLNIAAMPEVRGQIQVQVIQAQIEEEKWLMSKMPIFYKSDTQGFDEKIAASLSMKFWSAVQCAAFELWRINKPEFDIRKFAAVLESFPYMVFESNPNTLVKPYDVLTYINGTDKMYDDLLCWR